jgi:hypothetical protein
MIARFNDCAVGVDDPVTGLAGVSSPTFYIGTTAAFAVSIPPGTQDATIVSEFCAAGDAWRLGRRYR